MREAEPQDGRGQGEDVSAGGAAKRMPPMGGGKEKPMEEITITPEESAMLLGSEEKSKSKLAAEAEGNPEKRWGEGTVMGIKGELFTLGMNLLHDISGHFRGESYTITIEVTPEWVKVSKTPKE